MKKPGYSLQDEGMFVARAPLLALDIFHAWSQAQDKRQFLRQSFRHPLLQQALYLASPSLYERYHALFPLEEAQAGAQEKKPDLQQAAEEEKLDLALAKYLARAAYRCTPFGLFASVSTGKIGAQDVLPNFMDMPLQPRIRLDFGQQGKILRWLLAQDEVRRALRYRLNGSLYAHGSKYYYVEAVSTAKDKLYQLSQVEREVYLDQLFAAAREFRPLPELVQVLQEAAQCEADEALAYLEELIAADLLQPELGISITGQESFARMCEQLQSLGRADLLSAARESLQAMPRRLPPSAATEPTGMPLIATAEALLQALQTDTGQEFERKNLLQVDVRRDVGDATLCLGQNTVEQLIHAATCISAVTLRRNTYLDDFKRSFGERYGESEVPLLLVFNDELGIPFPKAGNPISELLQGIDFPLQAKGQSQQISWTPFDALMLRKYEESIGNGGADIVLTEDDLAPFINAAHKAFGAGTHLHASLHVLESGTVQEIYLQGCGGRTGLELLGRFCDVDPDLQREVERMAAVRNPDDEHTVYAEVVHLPQDRLANIVARPHLCKYEIVCMGHSGLAQEQQIALEDLQLSLRDKRFVLRSKRLNKYVVPRMSTAHNVYGRNVSIYQFLSVLSQQDQVHHGFQWSSVLNNSSFLPRVKIGEVVVQLATWRLPKQGVTGFKQAVASGEQALLAWREQYHLPRYVSWAQGDNVLPVDLENPAMCAMLLGEIENFTSLTLNEALPLAWYAKSGGQTVEVVLPLAFHSNTERPAKAAGSSAPPAQTYSLQEPYQYQVGGAWMYYKLYCGQSQMDELLVQHLRPLMQGLQAAGQCGHWFFIRYADPEQHLRLRAWCPQAAQRQALSEAFAALSAELAEKGLFWKLEMGGYQREVQRYGGLQALELCESLFAADSALVTSFLQMGGGEEAGGLAVSAGQRWLFSSLYVRAFLGLFFSDFEAQRQQVQMMAEGYRREFGFGARQKVQLGARYRSYRQQLDQLVFARSPDQQGLRETWLKLIGAAMRRIEPVVHQLLALQQNGKLEADLASIVGSLVHMHCNRMFASGQRAHEAVFYDFMQRIYGSLAATEGGQGGQGGQTPAQAKGQAKKLAAELAA